MRVHAAPVFWKFERAVILAVGAAVIAILTAVLSVFVLRLQHAAPGEQLFPGTAVEYALAWAVPSAAVAYPFLVWGLLRTRLVRSLLLVATVSLVVTPPALLVFAMHGLWIGFLASLLAISFCRRRFVDDPDAAQRDTASRTASSQPMPKR